MIVTKNLTVSSIEVDLEEGTIWVNAPHCKMRISGLEIKNPIEDFSLIDITNGVATMSPKHEFDNSDIGEEMSEFLIHLTNYLHDQFKTNEKITHKKLFLDDMKDSMIKCVAEKYSK